MQATWVTRADVRTTYTRRRAHAHLQVPFKVDAIHLAHIVRPLVQEPEQPLISLHSRLIGTDLLWIAVCALLKETADKEGTVIRQPQAGGQKHNAAPVPPPVAHIVVDQP